MTTHISTHNPARADVTHVPAARTSRTWAAAGIVAGVAGLGTIVTSSMVNGAYDDALRGDVPAQAAKLADQTGAMFAFHTFTLVCAVSLVVFAAGLFRRTRRAVGSDALAPLVALAGLAGTAVVLVLGSGLDTEFMMGLGEEDLIDPTNAVLYNHWVGTIPWCWVLAGLAGLAVHLVGRSGGVPRWIGRVGLVLGGLTLLVGISPFQYMAGATGPLWLLVTAIGFYVGDRASR